MIAYSANADPLLLALFPSRLFFVAFFFFFLFLSSFFVFLLRDCAEHTLKSREKVPGNSRRVRARTRYRYVCTCGKHLSTIENFRVRRKKKKEKKKEKEEKKIASNDYESSVMARKKQEIRCTLKKTRS